MTAARKYDAEVRHNAAVKAAETKRRNAEQYVVNAKKEKRRQAALKAAQTKRERAAEAALAEQEIADQAVGEALSYQFTETYEGVHDDCPVEVQHTHPIAGPDYGAMALADAAEVEAEFEAVKEDPLVQQILAAIEALPVANFGSDARQTELA